MYKKNKGITAALLVCALVLLLCASAFADDGTIHISSADDLVILARNCTLDTWSQDKTVELDADVSLDGVDFAPIPSFGGTFNGNGHTISGLTISGKYSTAGLFAELQESAVVKNLNVSGTVDISGSAEATGGIAGVNNGRIYSSSFTGSVSGSVNVGAIAGQNALSGSIRNCASSGSVYGSRMTGGIAGSSRGLISSCRNSSYVNTVSADKALSIQDISIDTTLDLTKLSSRDTVASTTDTGGIAGYSAGIIRSSSNSAIIGYQHVGYNVGGIAGRSYGYISGCRNSGTVYGRKDVGGIVGQMEPYMELNVENSMLARLQQQLDELNELVNKAADDAEGGAGGISSRLNNMTGYIGDAINEAGDISVSVGGSGQIDGEANGDAGLDVDVSIPPLDVDIDGSHSESGSVSGSVEIIATPDLGGLTAAINGIGSQLSMLNGALAGTAGALADDVRAINDKFNELSNTMFDAIFTVVTEESDILVDTSDVDIELVRLGKVCSNTNSGSVSGDINVGGVAGAIAIEYEYDPEDDVSSNISAEYKSEYELKAVLQNCTNTGSVDARRSYAGSVAGRMDLGIITDCRGFGDVSSESGDYAGGIAGLAGSTIRSCWAKCTLTGGKYVGGIVGSGVEEAVTDSGSTVTGCVSMVEIEDAAQYYGAISGADAGEYLENYFVSDSLAGIDGRSIRGKAEPISYDTLLGMEQLPAEFRTLHLSFVADDETLKTVDFNYGDSFGEDVFPDIPAKDGYYAAWDKTDLSNLHFDTVVTADYELEYSAVMADGTRNEKPVLFAEGKFDDSAKLYYTSADSSSGLTPLDGELGQAVDEESYVQLPWLARLTTSVSGGLVEQLHVTIPDDGQSEHTLHYLPPEVSIGKIAIYVMQDGRWVKADTEEFGSYLSFDVEGSEVDVAAVSVISVWWIWGALALVVIAIAVTIIASVKKRRRRRIARAAESGAQAETAEQPVEEAPAQKKRRRKPAVVIAVILICALAAAAVLFVPQLMARLAPYCMLSELCRAQELSMQVHVDAQIGGDSIEADVPVSSVMDGDTRITRAVVQDIPLYYSNDLLILENGKSFGIGDIFPDYSELLASIASMYKDISASGDGSSHRLSLSGDQAAELLRTLCPELTGRTKNISGAYVELAVSDKETQRITLSAEGTLDDASGTGFRVDAVIDGFTYTAGIDIPEEVALAAENGGGEREITEDLFRLLSAWAELDNREASASTLKLSADCGPVVLNTSLEIDSVLENGTRIYRVGKNGLRLYTDGRYVVGADGESVTDDEIRLADTVNLLDAAYRACLDGSLSAAQRGDDYIYTVQLDGDAIDEIVELIAPDAAKLAPDFTYGTISLTVSDGKFSSMSVSCTGTMKVVLVETPVSVSADISIQDAATPQFPAKAVAALTQTNG